MSLGPQINDAILSLVALEHRFDPYFRDSFDAVFQRPLGRLIQKFMRAHARQPRNSALPGSPRPGAKRPSLPASSAR